MTNGKYKLFHVWIVDRCIGIYRYSLLTMRCSAFTVRTIYNTTVVYRVFFYTTNDRCAWYRQPELHPMLFRTVCSSGCLSIENKNSVDKTKYRYSNCISKHRVCCQSVLFIYVYVYSVVVAYLPRFVRDCIVRSELLRVASCDSEKKTLQ